MQRHPPASPRRRPGPIATGSNCSSKAVDHDFQTTSAAAYGSRIGARFARLSGTTWGESMRPRSRGAISPELLKIVASLENRGRTECRVGGAPAVRGAKNVDFSETGHTQ